MKITKYLSTFLAAIGLSTMAHSTVVSGTAVADDWFWTNNYTAFVTSGSPNDVYLRTWGNNGADNRSALEFSLAGISPGATINSATFSIQSRGPSSSGLNSFKFWGYGGDGTITAADAFPTANLLATVVVGADNTLYSINVTSFIQSLVNVADDYAGILITLSNQGGFRGTDFCSSQAPGDLCSASNRPWLTVNFSEVQPISPPELPPEPGSVPEPESLALFGLALAGLGLTRRRANQA